MTELYETMTGSDEDQIKYIKEIFEEFQSYEWGWKHLRGIISGIRAVIKPSEKVDSFLLDMEGKIEGMA